MYAPIYLPPSAPRTPTIAAAERAIIEPEGLSHVDGRYFANEGDAGQERRRVAERRVREAERGAGAYGCLRGTCDAAPRFRLSTWATTRERQQIDAGAVECVRATHRDTLAEVVADFTNGSADGALISAARVTPECGSTLRALVHGFPTQIAVGLIGEVNEAQAVAAAVLFGQVGMRLVADVRTAQGWRELRNVFDCGSQPDQFIRKALAVVLRDIDGPNGARIEGRNEFFRIVFSPRVTSAKELAARLRVVPSTLMSRFFRAALPSPKQYVTYARLVWAAHLAESPAMSIAAIADRLNASSPQSFYRTVRIIMGVSAGQFRQSFDGARMLDAFCSRLIIPYRDTLRTFDPAAESSPTFPQRPTAEALARQRQAEQGRAA